MTTKPRFSKFIFAMMGGLLLLQACNHGSHLPLEPAAQGAKPGAQAPSGDGSSGEDSSGGLTFYGDAQPIFENRCLLCHDGESLPNWTDFATASASHQKIRDRLNLPPNDGRRMPPDNVTELTDEERALLIAWVDGGAVEGTPSTTTGAP